MGRIRLLLWADGTMAAAPALGRWRGCGTRAGPMGRPWYLRWANGKAALGRWRTSASSISAMTSSMTSSR
eukprot:5796807-Pyramimonas_sp.AAC.1